MAKSVIRYDLLVSCPGDIVDEKPVIADVIDELNRTVCLEKNIVLSPIRWETHSFPDISSDPQAVLNKQLGNTYDIFLGILCKRFGTPTGRADSGTEEEFKEAYSRYQQTHRSPRIMFYFRTPSGAPTLDELEQYRKVLEFKKSLGPAGVLYCEYRDSSEFKDLIRVHLSRMISTLGANDYEAALPGPNSLTTKEPNEPEDDTGLFELVEFGSSEFAEGLKITGELTESMNGLNSAMNEVVMKMELLKNADPTIQQVEGRKLADRIARGLLEYGEELETQTVDMAEHYRAALQTMARVVAIALDFGAVGIDQIRQYPTVLREFRNSVSGSRVKLAGLAEKISTVPRATTALARARARFARGAAAYDEEMKAIERLAEETEKSTVAIVEAKSERDTVPQSPVASQNDL